jgi:DNA glycosylase AlkZ-like
VPSVARALSAPLGKMCPVAPSTTPRVLRQRLATQRLSSAPLPTPADVVRLLTCVQSQERDHAFYSLGLRGKTSTYAGVRAAYDAGTFLRTHILRPTWHFVLPEDLRWILSLTSPRVEASMKGRHRQLGLDDDAHLERALDTVCELLQGHTYLTRAEITAAFAARPGLPSGGQELGHVLLVAELRGLIVSAPLKGVQHSYALVDEVVPREPELDRDEALVRLARRFFAGHGPASVKDFTRWSSLTVADTKRALAEIGDGLERTELEGIPLWHDPETASRRRPGAPSAYLFPVYDEAVLTYPALNFPSASDHPYAERPDPFWAWVVADDVNVGLWKRTVKADRVVVDVRLAPSVDRAGRSAVEAAAQRLATFLERDLEYLEGDGKPHLWGGDQGHPATRPRRAARA